MKKMTAALLALGLILAAGYVNAEPDPTNEDALQENIRNYFQLD